MDLENYEAELADYSLQDSAFYESAEPINFNIAAINSVVAAVTSSSLFKLTNSSKMEQLHPMNGAINGNSNNENTIDGGRVTIKKEIIKDYDDLAQGNDESNSGIYNWNSSKTAINGCDPQIKKKKKCVSFLPRYVQVMN